MFFLVIILGQTPYIGGVRFASVGVKVEAVQGGGVQGVQGPEVLAGPVHALPRVLIRTSRGKTSTVQSSIRVSQGGRQAEIGGRG